MPSPKAIAEDLHKVLHEYAAHKSANWEPVFELCDKYYAGFRHNRRWPGSTALRSNLKLTASADIAETLYSHLCHTLFYSGGENFFQAVSEDVEKGQIATDRLRFILHAPVNPSGRTSFWALKRTLRHIVKYGIGFTTIRFDKLIQRPVIQSISPWDLFWSPTSIEWIDDSPKVFLRFFKSLNELEALRENPSYKIPSRSKLKDLLALGANNQLTNADEYKRSSIEAQLGNSLGQNLNQEPELDRLTIYRVSTSDFIYWLLTAGDYQEIIYAAPNRLQTQPYTAGLYRPVLEAFGGVSPIRLMSGEHELQQLITNALLDGIELSITPPMRSGPGYDKQRVWQPGKSFIGSNEKVDMPIPAPASTTDAFATYAESRARMFRIAGTNEMAVTGLPTPSNANRTLGGIQLQDAAREQRAFGVVEEIESMLIVPTLLKVSLLDKNTINSSRPMPTLNGDKQIKSQDSSQLPHNLHIEVRGATRMVGIARLSALFQPLTQYYFAPEIQSQALKIGKTLDFDQMNRFVNEALGIDRLYEFYREATPEEIQLSQQAEMQKAQIQAQSRAQSDQLRSQTQVLIEKLRAETGSDERAVQILELLLQDRQKLSDLKKQAQERNSDDGSNSET